MEAIFPAASLTTFEQLFDHVPDTVFFIKDIGGCYLAVNQTLVERCGRRVKQDLIGRRVSDLFPADMAGQFAAQDRAVLRTGRPIIDRLELHWHPNRRAGWCLTTKIALRDEQGKIIGLAGISRDLRAPGDKDFIPRRLADVLDHLENHFDEPISPSELAKKAGLSPVRFARLIKRIFRLTPGQLITQTRLAEASRQLQETDRAVAEIAHACGFYDHSAFTRAFRSATGITPTEFRLKATGFPAIGFSPPPMLAVKKTQAKKRRGRPQSG